MARIMLVSGAVSGKKRYGKLEKAGSYMPPYGLLLIGAMLEKAGHEVALIDREVQFLPDEKVLDRIVAWRPDAVGLSVFTIGSEEGAALARTIKGRFPDLPVIAGGPHVFVAPELLQQAGCFDYLVKGEGEQTIVELIDALSAGAPVDDVDGLSYQKDGAWTDTAPRSPIKDLDTLPQPAFHLLGDISPYHPTPFGYRRLPILPLVTSRGCPFECIFCSRLWGRNWRAHSADYVIDLANRCVTDFKVKELWFTEDTFAINRQRVVDICEGLIRTQKNLVWSCMTNIHVLDEELLALMKRAGCWQIQLGLESGDDQVLKFIKKPIQIGLVREKVNLINKAGIMPRGFFILGHLVDTPETIQRTIDFALSLPLYTAEFHILHLPLGSEARVMAADYGQVNYDLALLTGYTESGLSFVAKGLTEAELLKQRRAAHNRFFLRPKQLLRFLADIKTPTDLKRYWLIGQAFLQTIGSGL